MNICFGDWRIEPYKPMDGRCWQVRHRVKGRDHFGDPMRYYDELGRALAFCAEWDLRNGIEGDYDLEGAVARYEGVRDSIVAAAEAVTL
ncbi:hypothetical protein [Olsenella uli]|uniref:hypothetical protein n=1 Tax=Olsenella uli TaxID=133926 RepID=UPI0028EBF626|nr:hypothetical protein [Olsenella uli]